MVLYTIKNRIRHRLTCSRNKGTRRLKILSARKRISARAALALFTLCLAALVPRSVAADVIGVFDTVIFSCSDDEATVAAQGGAHASRDGATVYVGYREDSSGNKDPVVALFDDKGVQRWCHADYEMTPVESKAYGVLWDEGGLYVVLSIFAPSADFNYSWMSGGWLSNDWVSEFCDGRAVTISAISQLDLDTGDPLAGTFVASRSTGYKANTLLVDHLCWVQGDEGPGHLRIEADAWYSPLRVDLSRMPDCTGLTPLDYVVDFSPSLDTVSAVSSSACGEVVPALSRGCFPYAVYLPLVVAGTP